MKLSPLEISQTPSANSPAGNPGSPGELRVASFPDRNSGNPYIELFLDALKPYGIVPAGRVECSPDWLQRSARRVHVLHFHWPERIWRGKPKGRWGRWSHVLTGGSARGAARLNRFLERAGQLGIKRVWTLHNLEHHEGASRFDRWGYQALARHCDLVICHSQWAADQFARQADSPGKTVVMRHGTYDRALPQPNPREQVLPALGLDPGRPLVSCLGLLRRYKGVEVACEAVQRLAGRVQFVVAGAPRPSRDRAYWQRIVSCVPGAVLVDRRLDDQEFSDLLAASDAVLLPYHKVTGSGMLLAAWSRNTGVVASDLPYFREMIEGYPHSGALFLPEDAGDLSRAIVEHLDVPRQARSAAVAQAAQAHSWSRCVEPVARIMAGWRSELTVSE